MNRIAFLMPTFNRAGYIAEALDAVTRQMAPEDELLVLDDGSTDGTEAVVRAHRPEVRYVRQDNRGKSAALNHALAITDSEYVWICDDDDVTRPGTVALLFDRLSASDADFAFGRHSRFRMEGNTRIDMGTGYWPDLGQGSVLRHMLEDSFVMQNATLVRRSAFAATGPFDETLPRSIDYDMFVRLALACRADHVDTVIFDQRKHEGVRGPATNLHAASASMAVWADYDRRIFDKLADTAPLAIFEGLFEAADPRLLRRAALLQRACVWARHQRWNAAIKDIASAATACPERALDAGEMAICGRILNGKHGFAALLDSQLGADFGHAITGSPIARSIGWSIGLGIVWLLRHHEIDQRRSARSILLFILRHTQARGLLSATVGRRRAQAELRERTVPLTLLAHRLTTREQHGNEP